MSSTPAPWPKLFEEHYGFVRAIVRRLAGPELDADDLTQDVFVVVHRRLSSLRDPTRLRPWLYGIARRVVSQARRQHKLRTWLWDRWRPPAGVRPSPEGEAAGHQLELVLLQILDDLPRKSREALLLYAFAGMGGEEIAETLKIPVATVWTRLHAARQHALVRAERRGLPIKEMLACPR